jgi:hypothetical protein
MTRLDLIVLLHQRGFRYAFVIKSFRQGI